MKKIIALLASLSDFRRFEQQENKFGTGIAARWGFDEAGKRSLCALSFDAESFSAEAVDKWLKDHSVDSLSIRDESEADLQLRSLEFLPDQNEIEWRNASEIRQSSDKKKTVVVINTDDLDTYSTIIRPEGVSLERYRKNPIVLINHDRYLVAGNSDVAYRSPNLVAEMPDEMWDIEDGMIAPWFRKVKKGIVRAASIGFRILESAIGHKDGQPFLDITKSELFEWSFLSVPSNPNALVIERSAHALPAAIDSRLQLFESSISEIRTLLQSADARRNDANPFEPIQAQLESAIRGIASFPGQIAEIEKRLRQSYQAEFDQRFQQGMTNSLDRLASLVIQRINSSLGRG